MRFILQLILVLFIATSVFAKGAGHGSGSHGSGSHGSGSHSGASHSSKSGGTKSTPAKTGMHKAAHAKRDKKSGTSVRPHSPNCTPQNIAGQLAYPAQCDPTKVQGAKTPINAHP